MLAYVKALPFAYRVKWLIPGIDRLARLIAVLFKLITNDFL